MALPSLATAAELLAQRGLSDASGLVSKLGLETLDTPDSDRVRLHLVVAMLQIDASDEVGARKALGEALALDQNARMPEFASAAARARLEDVRARVPFKAKRRSAPLRVSPPHERLARDLARAFDALYRSTQLEAARLVLDLTDQARSLSRDDQVQLAMRQGLLFMESAEEEKAARVFQQALELDPDAKLPEYGSPKALSVFLDVRASLLAPGQVTTASGAMGPAATPGKHIAAKPKASQFDPGYLLVGGGLTIGVGGLVLLASSLPTPPATGGQVTGGAIAAFGIVAVVGGLILNNRPEVLALQVTVSPVDRGGVLVAAGHF